MAASAWALREHGPKAPADGQDPEFEGLAHDLFQAARVAQRLKALITISH